MYPVGILLFLFWCHFSPFLLVHGGVVKPIWKTPVSEPNPTQNIEIEPDKEHVNLAKRAQPNYYTRPEQVSIPDYRAPRPHLPSSNPPSSFGSGFFRPFAWVGPQPKAGSPQTSYYNQVPNKSPSFPLPPFPPNWQQYPVQMIWIPDGPGIQSPPNVGSPHQPPQYGLYGPVPVPVTRPPLRPAVNPETYTGTPIHSPSASPTTTEEGYGDTRIPDSYGQGVTGPTRAPENAYNTPGIRPNSYGSSIGKTRAPESSNPYGSPNVPTHPPEAPPSSRRPYQSPVGQTHPPVSPSSSYAPTRPESYGSPVGQTNPPLNPNSYGSPDVPTHPPQNPHQTSVNSNPYGSPNVPTHPQQNPHQTSVKPNPYGSPNVPSHLPPGNPYESPSVPTHPPFSSIQTQPPIVNPYESPSVATHLPEDTYSSVPSSPPQPPAIPEFSTSQNPTIRPGPQEFASEPTPKSTLPYDADETSEISEKSTPIFKMSTNPFDNSASSSKTVPPVYLGPEEETDDISDTTRNRSPSTSSPPSSSSEDDDMLKSYFPRPANEQGYQPPGHQPDTHINVNFKKPKGCVGEICHGVDTDKISLYKPDRDNEGSGPTLVISNAAKDDASRAGYRPPQPPLVNPYIPPPPPPINPDDYNTPYTNPPYHPFPELKEYTPKEFVPPSRLTTEGQKTTDFPSSQVFEDYDTTTVEPFSPTALTIAYETSPTEEPSTTGKPTDLKHEEDEDKPEYVPPAIAHMTASTPSGKNPPTFIPLHPETSTTSSDVPKKTIETQTPATVTRQPEFPVRPSPGTAPTQILTTNATPTTTETYVTSSTEIVTEAPTTTTEVPTTTTTEELVTEAPTTITSPTIITDRISPSSESTLPSEQPSTSVTVTSSDRETTVSGTFETVIPSEGGLVTSTVSLSTTTTPRPVPTSRAEWIYTTDKVITERPPPLRNNPYAPPEGAPRVPNRLIGKPRILCKEDGISFEVKTILPFTGEIFANDRKRVEGCQQTFTDEPHPQIFLPFDKCGVKNIGDQIDNRAQYHMQVVLIVDQGNGTNTLQSFMAQCVHQKVNYNKQVLPKRIEEALEELKLIPAKLEQKASMPSVQMQIVVDEGHHKLGQEVMAADIGMPLALRWSLVPESDAYGMHIRNCKVVDAVGKIDHTLIDEQGCSADLQIIDHPHYDTYHDTASAHMWAFKVPDMASLQIKCDILVCSNIKSSITNTTSCENIPSPPFCADVVTSPPNSILSDASSYVKPRRSYSVQSSTQSVRTSICLSQNCRPQNSEDVRVCINTQVATISTGLSLAFLMFAISFQVIARSKFN